MKLSSIRQLYRCFTASMIVAAALCVSSCGAVYDDEPYCNQGLAVRFVYDYNMEFADAFTSQVHCLSVFVYDAEGRCVRTVTETDRSRLSDGNWRMAIDLPEGTYSLLAYGGMACADASFRFTEEPSVGSLRSDMGVALKPECLSVPQNLHPLFYGDLDVASVGWNDTDYVEVTVKMMKDTNNFRILLQNVDGTPVHSDDYTFTITDSNTLFDWRNLLLPSPEVTYRPWASGDVEGGQTDDGALSVLAYAEFATSRLVTGSAARLTIVRKSDGRMVLSIPLIRYLLMLKSQEFGAMGNQEFLDRESRWNMIFFLDSTTGGWISTSIVINDWVVRINDIGDL